MKIVNYTSLVLGLIALSDSACATITINGQFGQAFAVNGTTTMPNGTLWALIVDGGDSVLPGMNVNSSLAQTAASGAAGVTLINTTFSGKSFTLGTLFGTDTVFAMGKIDSLVSGAAGGAAPALNLTLGVNGLVTGRNYGFYYFPGLTFTTTSATYTVGSSVGGINSALADSGAGTSGMVIPSDGATVTQGVSTSAGGAFGGSTPDSSFKAVALNAVPEPSAILLGAIGALGLLRRRRN